MKKLLLIVILAAMLVGCNTAEPVITFTVGDSGIAVDHSDIIIENLSPGARAEATYRIENKTQHEIMPEIFINFDRNVEGYVNADGAINPPGYVAEWMEIPEMPSIASGKRADILVAIQVPEDAEIDFDRIGFTLGVAGRTDVMMQPAVEVWWIIGMR